jgi:hypothetical protein
MTKIYDKKSLLNGIPIIGLGVQLVNDETFDAIKTALLAGKSNSLVLN